MAQMQAELDAESPELGIKILGVNEVGHESGNDLMTDGRDLPWLQDVDDNNDGSSDVWDSWDITFRDVVITDTENVQVAVYNVTNNDLANSDNYNTLKQLLIDAATPSTDPTVELAAIPDQSVLAGSPLLIPLNGLDPSGGDLTFSVESSNPDISAEILEGNRSVRMQVDDFGAMTFQLFESHAPRATARIIELAEDGFYEDTLFHRVIDDFVIQGGDPTGTGAGGSDLGDFDDQYHVDLQHNRTGLLSMAKTTDDTNDSQFFITEGPSRHLDFNHTIFGLLTEGEDVREAISEVATDSSNRPNTDINLHHFDVIEDTENGVLLLKADEGATGTSTITVTATDGDGTQATRSFTVTLSADSIDSNPFLDDIAPVRMEANSVSSFQLTAQDAEGGTDYEFLGEAELDLILSPSQMPSLPTGLEYTVDSSSGQVTITASDNLIGEHLVRVGVRKPGTQGNDASIDSQLVPVTLGVITVNANEHSSGSEAGDGASDTISLVRNTLTYDISVNGELVRAADENLVFAIDLVGSSDDDLFSIDCSQGPPIPVGGIHITGGGEQSTDGDALAMDGGSFSQVTHVFTDASSGSVTIESNAPIEYSGLEPITDGLLAQDRVFEFASSDDEITIGDDGNLTNGFSRIASTDSSETVDFEVAPGGRVTVRTGAGDDQVTASDLDPTRSSVLTIAGNDGDDALDASAMTEPVTLTGGSGNDVLTGGTADDLINGQFGDDTIRGGSGDDNLLGGSGRDLLDGGDGSDRLRAQGYSGDTLLGSGGSDVLSGGDGTDAVSISADADITLADAQVTVGAEVHQIADVERAELTGGDGANAIDASGFTGDTTLSGGDGSDTITGSAGVTLLHEALDSNLTLTNSSLTGPDTDVISDIDRARLIGGAGDNTLDASGFSGPVTLRGSGGDDTLIAGDSNDLVLGGTGADSINAGAGDDDVRAGSGNDTVDAGDGDDSVRAGAGNDSVDGAAGNDTINGANGRDTLEGGSGNDGLSGLAGFDQLIGGDGQDTLVAGAGADTLDGGPSDDILLGGAGGDSLVGADGTDTLAGEGGADSFDADDEVNELFSFYAAWIDRV